jgi:uncharacterized membrane protein
MIRHKQWDPTWIIHVKAGQRLIMATAMAFIAFLVQPNWIPLPTRGMISWDTGTLVYLTLAWMVIMRADARMTRDRTLSQDQSGYIIFLLVVGASCASVVAIGFMQGIVKNLAFWPKAWHLALSVIALISSWLLIQTVFAFHYARRYYAAQQQGKLELGPLVFPGQQQPDYSDFAYYAFVVGMTSQVSDVAVTSRRMRHLTLIHGTLSFIFNIAVLALSINIIAGAI